MAHPQETVSYRATLYRGFPWSQKFDYTSASGEDIAISTHLHLLSDHVAAAMGAGWSLAEMHERIIDAAWIALKPTWARFRQHPISFVFVWRKLA